MGLYNFKQGTKLYLVFGGFKYSIDISDLSFSQTFTEDTYPVRTLHTPKSLFDSGVIVKANPGTFELKIYAIKEPDFKKLFELACKYNSSNTLDSFDLYVETTNYIFKLETCVITAVSFNITKEEAVSFNFSGDCIKIQKIGNTGSYTIPGTTVARSSTTSYNIVKYLEVELNNIIIDNIFSVSIELQNDIEWFGHTTVQAVMLGDIIYPQKFSLEKRILSGSISAYMTTDTWMQTGVIAIPAFIKAGEINNNVFTGVTFDIPLVSLTTRTALDAVVSHFFDWRMMSNPSDLTDIVSYSTT